MSNEIKVEGLDEVLKSFDKIVSLERYTAALGKACAIVERAAKQKAPKGNGELSRSITSKVDIANQQGIIFTTLEYAPYVEYGTGLFAEEGQGRQDVPWHYQDEKGEWHTTSGMNPHPYMRPALDENRLEVIRIIKEGLTSD